MTSTFNRLSVLAALGLLAFGGIAEAQVTNYSTEGNLESLHDIGCAGADDLSDEYSPADLRAGLIEGFEPEAAWEKALDSYLHCPKL